MPKQTKLILAAGVAVIIVLGGYSLYNQPKSTTPTTPTSQSQSQTVSYDCQKGKTALVLLEAAHQAETKDTSFGKQIVGIDGAKPAEKQYWAFYVDGKLAPVGAETYTCTGSEKVEWKLESF